MIDYINAGFTNRDKETARGIDINYERKGRASGDRLLDTGIDISANKMIERTLRSIDNTGNPDEESIKVSLGYPEWTAFIRNYVS